MTSKANPKTAPSIDGLPGAELIRKGFADLRERQLTAEACLIAIARPRLARAGFLFDLGPEFTEVEPELTLYRLLRQQPGDAYSRYNSLLRRLVSFERALDTRINQPVRGRKR